MESLLDETQTQARNAKNFANGQINTFIDNVEDLTKALKDVETPEIARVRAKVKIALAAAKSALADSASQVGTHAKKAATQVGTQARQVGKTTDTYVRDNPWQVVGIAALIGVAVGVLAARRFD